MSVKGYPSQTALERGKADFATVEPVRGQQRGLSVNAHVYVYIVTSDAAEAGSTTSIINATANVARVGDIINFTSGAFLNTEVKVEAVTANTITLVQDMPSAIATGVTFEILRPKYPVVGVDGSISVTTSQGPVQFVRDGVDTEVNEDTVTPANNRGLPVTIVGAAGEVQITAGSLEVHLSASGASPDSVRVSDGTDELAINADGSINTVVASSALPTGAATEVTLSAVNGKLNSLGQKAMAASVPVVIASDQSPIAVSGTVSTSEQAVVADGGALPAVVKVVGGFDGSLVQVIKTDAAGELQIDVLSSALPTGAATEATLSSLNGKVVAVDTGAVVVASSALPTGAATSAAQTDGSQKGQVVDGSGNVWGPRTGVGPVNYMPIINLEAASSGAAVAARSLQVGGSDGTNLRTLSTDATGQLNVIVTAALPAGTNNIGDVDVVTLPSVNLNYLSVVDFLDTPLLIASGSNIPASASTPLTVVASLAAAAKKMQILDTTGEYLGIYADPAGTPVLLAISGPGSDQTIEVAIPATTVIGVRNMKNAVISVGELAINFIG